MKRNTDIKIKVIECNSKSNLVVLQTASQTFTLISETLVEFINSASPIKDKIIKQNTIHTEIAKDVLDHLNRVAGKSFPYSDKNEKFITARLSEGETPEMLKKVIEVKSYEWKNDFKTKKWLRPETLFNSTKYESYKQEVMDIMKDPEAFKEHVKAKEKNERDSKKTDDLDDYI